MSQYIPILVGSEFGSDLGRMADEGRQVLPPIRLWDWLNTWRSCNIVTDHEIVLEEGAKLTLGGMYLIVPKHDAKLKEYL